MNTLVVGGTGMIGAHIAELLAAQGHGVTIMARREGSSEDPAQIVGMPRLVADYTDVTDPSALEPFEQVVFAAGQDIRHIPADEEGDEIWERVQTRGVPAFADAARRAGVRRFVQIGSYYHQLYPEWAKNLPYVAARKAADERTRALTDDTFAAITLNPPSIVGAIQGSSLRRFARMFSWLRGERPENVFAPPGGTNYMSVRSLAEATLGALERGEPGTAYLIGDQNLRYQEFFQVLADVAGSTLRVPERDEECPYQPDRFIVQGRGRVIAYQPSPADVATLSYRRDDVRDAVEKIQREISKAW
ncbi:NAD-dependent epimerase/dehydratase family protein [Microcella pacifica]|uniref:NAD-dependent epimerase/dehydratase family protein n=1 Tax=Microcella pacifica TaxID=2591847 RepID=A0A9E5JM28_9MICO|nr:NAD-dependent epimerase/dehydratase family protein [Microcella pacifica]NHF62124.1 NAD-dependent epimerase/dehydratase family protein [Microcella pacifica]